MILHQQHLDYSKHCQFSIGMYVQAHDEPDPSNTNAPRTLDCIYLRYNDNHQGGHDLLHIPTNHLITRHKVTQVPITPTIIKRVERLAEMDGMPPGLKITDRTGHILYDSAWLAGVDYEDSDSDDNDSSYEESDIDEDDIDEEDDYDHMDPDEIAGLADPDEFEQEKEQEEYENVPDDVDEMAIKNDKEEEAEDEEEEAESEEEAEEHQIDNPSTIKHETDEIATRSGRVSHPPD
jgi:hypothetical protein